MGRNHIYKNILSADISAIIVFQENIELWLEENILLDVFPWISEVSAKTCDGVQCAFEELVEKIIQTPGLWKSENQNKGVKLTHREEGQGGGACGGYCSVL